MADRNITELQLQGYRTIRPLGTGGWGSVWLAEDLRDHTTWAVKREQNSPNNQREARILSELSCPAFPSLYEIRVEGDNLYIIMEYIAGKTLAACITDASGKLFPEPLIIDWFRQLCSMLIYLHSRPDPVAYRDLKPTNIMVTEDRQVRLIDFGIAEEYSLEHRGEKRFLALTKGYAAPEQYDGRYLADVRTDIYALGATMHYLLTGKDPQAPPYRFEPVRKLVHSRSREIEAIVEQCLQPNPEKRYQTAADLMDDLTHPDRVAERLRKNKARRTVITVGTAAMATLMLVGIYAVAYRRSSRKQAEYYERVDAALQTAESGSTSDAESKLTELIAEDPNTEDAYLALAEVYVLEGKDDLAEQYIEYTYIPKFGIPENNDRYDALIRAIPELQNAGHE